MLGGGFRLMRRCLQSSHGVNQWSPPVPKPDLLHHIISILFPKGSSESNSLTVQIDFDEILEVIIEKIIEVAKKIFENRASGLADTPND